MVMYDGTKVGPDGAPDLKAISVHLTGINRFAGGTRWPVSLHSCVLADQVEERLEAHALLHDAPEAVGGDTCKDAKNDLNRAWEGGMMVRIYAALGLALPSEDEHRIIKAVDKALQGAEMVVFMPRSTEWSRSAQSASPCLVDSIRRYCKAFVNPTLIDIENPAQQYFLTRLECATSRLRRFQEWHRN